MKVFVSYMVVVLIALQSVFSILDTTTTHQYTHELVHQDSDHHTASELATLVTHLDSEESNHSNQSKGEKHPDCHQSHCHHGPMLFVELEAIRTFVKQNVSQSISMSNFFISYFLTPDLRPPIV
ncbi:MAG: hypothetical protein OQK09_13840 [Colwellia sp.]|nr:hypothetical protein [Colwellia sp.]MCW8864167.1 hypothetical protein [Colwellia sp.]MCW9082589.1 hypothetical protein [Colwellia sp.]